MKRSTPGTIEDAITQIIAFMGRKDAADAVGLSKSTVYNWGDEDHSSHPTAVQLLTLDLACGEKTGAYPVLEMWQALSTARRDNEPWDLFALFRHGSKEMHEALDAIGGLNDDMSPNEVRAVLQEIAEVERFSVNARRRIMERYGMRVVSDQDSA